MKDALIELLTRLGYPIFQQGSLDDDESYPESFFTFWNNAADGEAFYDDKENCYIWDFDLNFYSTDPILVNNKLVEAKTLLRSAGWIASSKGHDVASDEPTHTGRGMNIFYIEYSFGGDEEMTKLVALKNLVKKLTGEDSTATKISDAIEEINENYDPTTGVSKLSLLENDAGFITEDDIPEIPVAENQAAATAAGESDDVVKLSDFNALLTKLKAAGIMEADSII